MDDRHFDSLSRLFAQGASRRAVIRGLFAGGAAVLAGGALSASAKPTRVTMCLAEGDESYSTRDVPEQTVGKWEAKGYFVANDCGDGPTCGSCCIEWHEPCSNDTDCCSENCLDSGICGELCYCNDRYDPNEQAALGPMCGASMAWECNSENPGCLSSADCDPDSSYTTCIVASDCNASGGACGYALFPCEE